MLDKNVDKEGFRSLVLDDDRYRPFEGLGQESEGEAVATGKLEDVLQKLDEASLAEAGPEALLIDDTETGTDEGGDAFSDEELDLSAGEEDKASDINIPSPRCDRRHVKHSQIRSGDDDEWNLKNDDQNQRLR